MVYTDLFKVRHNLKSLDLAYERMLILQAQHKQGATGQDAQWQLLIQYSGLLQKFSYEVRARVTKMTPQQVEDLEADLVIAALEAIRDFDHDKYIRLAQALPSKLKEVAREMETALVVPNGTLSLWFKIWREAGQDYADAARLAPDRGMSANTFRAIQHALAHSDSEWVTVPFNAGKPTADQATYDLAHFALNFLTPAELEVIEYSYGFRGDVKTDQEVADLLETSKTNVYSRRTRGLERMRNTLTTADLLGEKPAHESLPMRVS